MADTVSAAAPIFVAETRSTKGCALRFPLRCGRRAVRTIRLHHPTFEQVTYLSQLEAIGAEDVLLATTTLPPAAIGAMRWPDVESVLEMSLDLLPPDLVARTRGPAEARPERPAAIEAVPSGPHLPSVMFAPAPPEIVSAESEDDLAIDDFLHRTDGLVYG